MSKWQFSLRGLFLLVLIVAMGLALFVSARRLRQAEVKLAEYRREYGILDDENTTKLQAVALWTGEPNHWRWRVRFPPGRYDICYATTGISASDFPASVHGWNADFNGSAEISVAAYKDPNDGVWRYAVSSSGAGGGVTSYEDMRINPDEEGMSSSDGGINRDNGPLIVSADQSLVLLRKRAVKKSVMEMNSWGAFDGLMLWVRRTGEIRGDNRFRSF